MEKKNGERREGKERGLVRRKDVNRREKDETMS